MTNSQQSLVFLKKFLQKEKFEIDSFIYDFFSITILKDYEHAFKFKVNVILPDPNQSYIVVYFGSVIEDLISTASKYLGESFSYSYEVQIDGKELSKNTYVKINDDTLNSINEFLNNEFHTIDLENIKFTCDFSWDEPPYDLDEDNLTLHSIIKLSNFVSKGKVVTNVSDSTIKAISEILRWDDEIFMRDIENMLYDILDEELKLSSIPNGLEITYTFRLE